MSSFVCGGKAVAVHMRIQEKRRADGSPRHHASLVRNDRVRGRTVQATIVYLGAIEEGQIPFLKAAYARKKPRLVWDG